MGSHKEKFAKMVDEKKKTKSETQAKQEVSCNDFRCAIHGELKTRGRVFEGKVVSAKMQKTITVEWPRLAYVPKDERYEKKRSKVKAHLPPCISVTEGDRVKIAECRPIAKTVKFVAIEKLSTSKSS